jgi:hypothetical protein
LVASLGSTWRLPSEIGGSGIHPLKAQALDRGWLIAGCVCVVPEALLLLAGALDLAGWAVQPVGPGKASGLIKNIEYFGLVLK